VRILLDHCMDVRVKRFLEGHDVSHTRDQGWTNLANGKLLATAATAGFVVMVTADKNIRHEQNLAALPLAVLELDLPRNRFRDIAPLASRLLAAVEHKRRFAFVSIKPEGTVECLAERVRAG